MKKTLLVLTLILTCLFTAFGWQENYTDESTEYKTYITLKRLSGSQQPIPTLPVSAEQLRNLVEHLDATSFTAYEKQIYADLLEELTEKDSIISSDDRFKFDLEGWLNANLLLRTGTDNSISAGKVNLPSTDSANVFDVKQIWT